MVIKQAKTLRVLQNKEGNYYLGLVREANETMYDSVVKESLRERMRSGRFWLLKLEDREQGQEIFPTGVTSGRGAGRFKEGRGFFYVGKTEERKCDGLPLSPFSEHQLFLI